jgi:hypothetical protein
LGALYSFLEANTGIPVFGLVRERLRLLPEILRSIGAENRGLYPYGPHKVPRKQRQTNKTATQFF